MYVCIINLQELCKSGFIIRPQLLTESYFHGLYYCNHFKVISLVVAIFNQSNHMQVFAKTKQPRYKQYYKQQMPYIEHTLCISRQPLLIVTIYINTYILEIFLHYSIMHSKALTHHQRFLNLQKRFQCTVEFCSYFSFTQLLQCI